eukprot:PhM_4_TR10788/c0_g1_i1/m.101470/K14777/DDX47, RRP3; ATP-dependent RNA helicase DDX47/RRP3
MAFQSFGLCQELQKACVECGWTGPTKIQSETMAAAISGRDIIGVAQTGSGKTGAYALPVIHRILIDRVKGTSTLVLVPNRELAIQVTEQFEMLGSSIGLKVVTILGGVDMVQQAKQLSERPHVIVATPGRLKDHIESTKGFRLHKIRFLILDEADKMLDMDYEKELDVIFEAVPRQGRQTILFSATMTAKVDKLQRASLHDPFTVVISPSKYQTVDTLQQYFVFAPFAYRVGYLHQFLTTIPGNNKVMIFCSSTHIVLRLTHTLRVLGVKALPLMGKLTQEDRVAALDQFRSGEVQVLVCTDVAQRGIDVPDVDVVVNYQLPNTPTDYIHRVGRTARIGRTGKAVTMVTQFDIDQYLKIEEAIGKKMEEIPISKDDVLLHAERVQVAEREATQRIREETEMGGVSNKRRKTATANISSMLDSDNAHEREGHALRVTRRENEKMLDTSKEKQRATLKKVKRTKS